MLLGNMKSLFLALILLLMISTPISAVEKTLADEVAGTISEELPRMLAEASVPGAAIAVVDGKRVVSVRVFGHTDGAGSNLVDTNTIFSIQSMSKSFAALAVLMAVQDGLVDLDAPIKEYLPGFTVKSLYEMNPENSITLRHLLSHWAGLVQDSPYGNNNDDRYDFDKHIQSIADTWLRYPVGYCYKYSNLGIDLAGYIIQAHSGNSFGLYVKDKVLHPIGMTNSLYEMDSIEHVDNRGLGHSANSNRTPPLRIPIIPAGGLYTDISDMIRYLQFHINEGVANGHRILRQDLLEQMHSIQFGCSGRRFGYCLGLIREPVSNSYGLYHAGAGYGFSSIMMMFPEYKLGVVLLTNSEDESTIWGLHQLVTESICAEYGETPVADAGVERMIKLDSGDPRVEAVMGRYGDEYAYVIETVGDTLGLRITSQNRFYPLTCYDDGGQLVGMFGEFSEIRVLPRYGNRAGSMMVVNRRLSNAYFNTKDFNHSPIDPRGPNRLEWSEYLGEYEQIVNGKTIGSFNVTVRNGYLYTAECKCTEYKLGVFFTYDGDLIDFTSDPPTANYTQIRKKEAESGK